MTLTLHDGPLALDAPKTANYSVDGPGHRVLLTPFPRRIRAVVDRRTLLDSTRAVLVHETASLPVLYVPAEDLEQDLLRPADHRTRCPYKGEASYWTIDTGARRREHAVWGYLEPLPGLEALADLRGIDFAAVDAWYDEDELIEGHVRDPYHRVDARRTSRRVVVEVDGLTVADSTDAFVVSETGLPNRWYLPPADVRGHLLRHSTTRTHCAYKGWATYWSMADGSADDIAFAYPDPMDDIVRLPGYRCFWGDAVTITVDGGPVAA